MLTCSDLAQWLKMFFSIALIHVNYNAEKITIALAVFILLINVKMPTIINILTFMGRRNFVLT